MPELVLPTAAVRRSFLGAMDEFVSEGRGVPADASMIGADLRYFGETWTTPAGFAAYLAQVRAEALAVDPARPDWKVPSTTWWWVVGAHYLGRIAVRHRLTPSLRRLGRHIGYDVRPSARRQGHASAMLAAVLPRARALGITRALITCAVDNVGSRRVIEANSGQLEDELDGTLRYWLDLA